MAKLLVVGYVAVTAGMLVFASLQDSARQSFISSNGYVLETPPHK